MRPKSSPGRPRRWLAALVLATFAHAPNGASAELSPVCKGRDLSASVDIKPDLEVHSAALLNGEGLLWKVERRGLAPSYFYGTIHSTNSAVVALAREAAAYMRGAKSVATELGIRQTDAKAKVELSSEMFSAAFSPKEDTLSSVLSAEDVTVVDAYLRARGYSTEKAHHLKLWFLAVAASQPLCEVEGARKGLPEVDQVIAEMGRAHGLPVIGLETAAEQLRIVTNVPSNIAATMLLATARAPEFNDDTYVTMLSLYSQKRPAVASAILDAVPGATPEERSAQAEFSRLLLAGRNELMIARASPLLAKGGAFIAVGAGHLPGKDGLIERARAAGYRVEKVW
jgi:uncharacterized protein YbaP (TraB family)